ncbi:unnamed protein product [Durusdinium trenchii]|uniref:Uncharacterized protein n=2 Tax=Durusdinium trenchii TaxID=1381693 RepID=A0ABP0IQ41_9DINO
MLVLLSSAMRFHAKPAAELAMRTTPRLLHKTKVLVQELRRLEAKDIKKQLHVNDALAKQYAEHLNQFEAKEPVPCCSLYDTPLYDATGFGTFDEDDADWANSNVRIFSGLYGILRPFDEIQTLSLPVGLNSKLTNSKGNFLRNFWQEHIEKDLEDALQRLPMPVIIDLAAEEDAKSFTDPERLPEGTRVVKVDFKISDKDAALSAKGEFLRWMLENRCMTVEELLEFTGLEEEAPSYRLNKNQQSADHLLFEEKVGDGGDGWRKKIQEYGGSKNKFIKEFASGKQKYQRTEMAKALKKEDKAKKKKGSSAFY